MQLELNLDIEVTKRKSRAQKDEEKRFEYFQRMFHGNLEQMSKIWNVPVTDNADSLTH